MGNMDMGKTYFSQSSPNLSPKIISNFIIIPSVRYQTLNYILYGKQNVIGFNVDEHTYRFYLLLDFFLYIIKVSIEHVSFIFSGHE